MRSDAYAVTRHARLRHFEERATDPVPIAYTYLVIGQAVDCKIFAELPERKIVAAEVSLPVAIGVRLVYQYRAMLSSVSGKISLPIANYIQPPDHPPALHRLLPDGGVHRLSSPGDVTRQTNVDGYKPSDRMLLGGFVHFSSFLSTAR